jgi:hypothetical protein
VNFSEAQVSLIDQRIDDAQRRVTKMGTVQDREGATARAIVSFDGSSGVGQPVKCLETVVVDIGDRVAMAKVEGEWVIIGSYQPRLWGDSLSGLQMSSTSTTTSATFVDMPTSPRATLAKYRDATQLQIFVACSMTTTVNPTVVEVGGMITLPDATTSDQVLFKRAINAASDHRDMSGGITTPGLTLPAGAYTVTARWRRVSGTGTLTMDSNDGVTVWAREVVI